MPLQLINPDDVRESIRRAKSSLERAAEEIVWQVEMEAWRTLGYSSWNAMREAEYGEAAFMVPRKDRPELVGRMRKAGLTQQEIAHTAGVSVGTVNSDLTFNSENDDPKPQPRPARRRPLPDAYRDYSWKVLKSVESVSRLHQDDRFKGNRESVKSYAPELARAANELLDLLDDLGIDRHKYGGSG